MAHYYRRQTSDLLTQHPQMELYYARSVTGGAGGKGTRVSTGTRASYGYGGEYDYQSSGITKGGPAIGNEKVAMQHLNDRLASYMDKVRDLEKANSALEIKIRQVIEKKGPVEGRDYSKYNAIISELRGKIFEMIKGNVYVTIALDNARLASEDFASKMEYEMSMRLTVEADVARLRKLMDDTNLFRLQLEGDVESLNEELITLKKNHQTDLTDLRAQISYSVNVDVDAPKGQDLVKIMEEIRNKYEKIALKNQEELKAWHENQMTTVQVQVTEQTTALKDAVIVLNETKRKFQALEIELQGELGFKESLRATLAEIERRYNAEMEKYNTIILKMQEELSKIRMDIQQNTREYESLLNIKVKLEAEIATYRRLLDGEDFTLQDALQEQKTVTTKVMTVTQTLVDGKVVSSSTETKDLNTI
ncbi:hypothetical protein PAMA_021013 [Pampus argenteus]